MRRALKWVGDSGKYLVAVRAGNEIVNASVAATVSRVGRRSGSLRHSGEQRWHHECCYEDHHRHGAVEMCGQRAGGEPHSREDEPDFAARNHGYSDQVSGNGAKFLLAEMRPPALLHGARGRYYFGSEKCSEGRGRPRHLQRPRRTPRGPDHRSKDAKGLVRP